MPLPSDCINRFDLDMAAKLVLVLLVAIASLILLDAQTSPTPQSSCGDINRVLSPCVPYLADRALRPPILCCMGAASVRRMALVTDQDRQAVCECLKGLASQFLSLDPARAARLPVMCGIHLNFPITSNVNCSNVPPLLVK